MNNNNKNSQEKPYKTNNRGNYKGKKPFNPNRTYNKPNKGKKEFKGSQNGLEDAIYDCSLCKSMEECSKTTVKIAVYVSKNWDNGI